MGQKCRGPHTSSGDGGGQFAPGSGGDVREEKGRIIIEPAAADTYPLDDLVAGITEANRHDPIEFGPAVGQEVW